ncbi:hypothetical protein CspeluHIS016_0101300 [Cutaneotrichosporon spelunceum]|uniref:Uncharacterized protein n=1 Tax=Cutaneotrichosporon spelunceum TaxID=1672016 RepID=A0AAD3Y9C4_9TREE|nr:hypothetical protein CspeluHIS016_0101300 [Cutaneotrichosporon spelunceum]
MPGAKAAVCDQPHPLLLFFISLRSPSSNPYRLNVVLCGRRDPAPATLLSACGVASTRPDLEALTRLRCPWPVSHLSPKQSSSIVPGHNATRLRPAYYPFGRALDPAA